MVPVPKEDFLTDDLKKRTSLFMRCLEEKIGNSQQPVYNSQNPQEIYYVNFNEPLDNDQNDLPYGEELIDLETDEINELYLESMDEYITNTQVVIPNCDGVPILAKFKKRKCDMQGEVIGEPHSNTMLDMKIYELKFPDGATSEYSVNTISKNLLNQASEGGWDTRIFSHIIELRKNKDVAIPKEEGTIQSHNGTLSNVIRTKGRNIQVQWSNISSSWLPLNVVKKSNPIELTEFAYAHNFHNVLSSSGALNPP